MKSMYLLDSQKCINYSIQRIAKRHLRCGLSLRTAKKGTQLCELRRGRGLGEGGWVGSSLRVWHIWSQQAVADLSGLQLGVGAL